MTLRAVVIGSEPCESYSHARPEVLDRPMCSYYNEDAKWIPASVKAQKNEPP